MQKQDIAIKWKQELKYQKIVNYFFVHDLKYTYGKWYWYLNIITIITASLALINLEEAQINEIYRLLLKGSLSLFAIISSLIASWIKKNNYVERINQIDRYLQEINNLCIQIENIIGQDPSDRVKYNDFIENYHEKTINILSRVPPMSPEEYKRTVYKLTKYYPELLENTWPWFNRIKINNQYKYKLSNFGPDILLTYDFVKYHSLSSKLLYCYYCRCKCYKLNIKNNKSVLANKFRKECYNENYINNYKKKNIDYKNIIDYQC